MTSPESPDWDGRLRRLRDQLARIDCEALVVSNSRNIAYLCGFAGSAGILLVGRDDVWLLIDGRYTAAVRSGIAAAAIGPVRPVAVELRYDKTLGERIRTSGIRRVGFEADSVTVATLRGWQLQVPDAEWQPSDALVEKLRMIKDAGEIAVLRQAARALAGVAARLRDVVGLGHSEREVARAIDRALEGAGFERPAFETIVASGPNTAYPHARPTDRRLARGDLVLLDFGGVLDGYCVDLTRMAVIGHMPAAIEPLFDAVKAAHEAAVLTVRPGVPTSAVDSAARTELERRGLGAAFNHGTGHGLGRDVHELPRITKAESAEAVALEAGMVFTVEPGAYVEGLGGVRLEDDVLVTADGCDVLTDVSRDLLVL